MPLLDLPTTPVSVPNQGGVRTLFRSLGLEDEFGNPPYPITGGLHFLHPSGTEATIYFQEGFIYASHMTGYTPQIVRRLKSAGCLTDEEYAVYKDVEPAEAGPRIVEELRIPGEILEETHREVLLATVSHLYEWWDARWYWEEEAATRAYVTSGIPTLLVVSAVDERIGQWSAVVRNNPLVTQPTVVPKVGPGWQSKVGVAVSPEMASMLSYINGRNTIAQIASACGFTRFEIAKLLAQATSDSVLDFDVAQPNVPAEVVVEDSEVEQVVDGVEEIVIPSSPLAKEESDSDLAILEARITVLENEIAVIKQFISSINSVSSQYS